MTIVSIASKPPVEESGEWTFTDSLGCLAIALAVAWGTLTLFGVVMHHIFPARTYVLVHAVDRSFVWVSILVLFALWLGSALVRQVRSGGERAGREPATCAGETEGGDGNVVVLSSTRGRGLFHRPSANREVAG